jgi:AraC family transcriptional regulator
MKDERADCSYHGAFLNRRLIKGLSLAEAVYAPKLELPKHVHQDGGFCLILEGWYTESYGKTLLECKPSDVKFHPAGESHSDVYGGEGVHSFILGIPPEWLSRMGASDFMGSSPLVYRKRSLAWLMMRLRAEFRSVDDESPLVIEGLVLELIAETSRSRKVLPANKPPLWIRRAKDFLDEQFSHPLPLSLIAEFVGVHPIYLANSFRQYYHMSIGEYLRHRRVKIACHKISTSKDSLVDIALAAGFSNQSHFSRIFKQVTGMTPAQYRAGCRSS